ncbi:hypothetical protein AB0I81_33140 [Nonomuraea sp. NPDC050404]|uniref:hypothetical protein n=1 Tax=Nonomuraea sp. NPDC050404 TaxID=3155783 RepID=UPI0033CD1691
MIANALLGASFLSMLGAFGAQPAFAAAGCGDSSRRVIDPDVPGVVQRTRTCTVYRPTFIFLEPITAQPTGSLTAGRHWFICQRRGGDNPSVQQRSGRVARNNWWLRTLGDRGGWGWAPATHVSGGQDFEAVPGLPNCAQGPFRA